MLLHRCYWHCPCSMISRVYVTVQCPSVSLSVSLSVPFIRPPHTHRERSLFTMSEHNKYIYKLDNGRLPERNNHHSWPPIPQPRRLLLWARQGDIDRLLPGTHPQPSWAWRAAANADSVTLTAGVGSCVSIELWLWRTTVECVCRVSCRIWARFFAVWASQMTRPTSSSVQTTTTFNRSCTTSTTHACLPTRSAQSVQLDHHGRCVSLSVCLSRR